LVAFLLALSDNDTDDEKEQVRASNVALGADPGTLTGGDLRDRRMRGLALIVPIGSAHRTMQSVERTAIYQNEQARLPMTTFTAMALTQAVPVGRDGKS
jgi:hypothetical protein